MIHFNPRTQIAIMPQDVAMKFMVWAGYYNGLELVPGESFARFTRESLDELFGKTLE